LIQKLILQPIAQIYSNGLLTATIFWDLLCDTNFLKEAKILYNATTQDKDIRSASMIASFLFSISSQKILNPKGKAEGVLWVVSLQSLKFSTSIGQASENIALGARLFLPFFSLDVFGELDQLIIPSSNETATGSDNYFVKFDDGAIASATSEPNIITIIPNDLTPQQKKELYSRIVIGRVICAVKNLWGLSLHLATASVASTPVSPVYKRFAADIEDKIANKWHLNRFVNEDLPVKGNDLMSALGIKGKQVGFASKVVRDYYLMNGLDTPKAACIEWLQGWWKQYGSSIP